MKRTEETFIYQLVLTEKTMINIVKENFKNHPITLEHYSTLRIVYEKPGITQQELATFMARDKNVIVRWLNSLENKGYLERRQSETDRRANTLHVTPDGERIAQAYWADMTRPQDTDFTVLTPSEKKTLLALLQKINSAQHP